MLFLGFSWFVWFVMLTRILEKWYTGCPKKKVTNRMMLEPRVRCTGSITSSRHTLSLEFCFCCFLLGLCRIKRSQVMSIGKNWPQSTQFWLGFFVFGTPCICKQENLKELRTNPLRVLLWKAQPGKSQCCNFRKCQISAEKSFESYSEGPVCTERTKVKNNFEVE